MKNSRFALPELGRRPGAGFPLPRRLLAVALGLLATTGMAALAVLAPPSGPAHAVGLRAEVESARTLRFSAPSVVGRTLKMGDSLSLRIGDSSDDGVVLIPGRLIELSASTAADSMGALVAVIGIADALPPPGGMILVSIGPEGPEDPRAEGGPLERLRARIVR